MTSMGTALGRHHIGLSAAQNVGTSVANWKLTLTIDGDTHVTFPSAYWIEDGVLTVRLSRGREPVKLKHIPMRVIDEITAEEIQP